ncbi:DUF4832 domain-containing protein [Paenibacillus psychroresistens]|uniref:DUF4832 domain-containing protein n=1 Tax=Paenibacillus psychroresistens TaxID=1778678 RepID=A0A6B8RQX2_9BACL|nr:DUF4832 domain-containing protein [Paenibacillus psychroresistens]QGQ98780.1 DUF4832 domain-containing protein [Paenibacillus psychroresistens]
MKIGKIFALVVALTLVFGTLNYSKSNNTVSAAIGNITVNPLETSEAFKNPNMGFRPSVYIGSNTFPDKEYTSIYKQYIRYTDLENFASDSVQKIKDWSNTAWAGIEARNIKVVPRVVIVYPNTGEFWADGIPNNDPVERWTSDTYKSRMVAFIAKLGQAWDNDPRVAAIELGLFGNWGEQHIWPLKFADGTDRIPLSFQTAFGNAYTAAFPNKKVMIRYPDTFTSYNFGTQWDSFALPDDATGGNGEISRDNWRTQINSGEVAYDWGNQANLGGSPDGTLGSTANTNYVIDWIMNTHTSSLGWIAEYNAGNPTVEIGATAMQKVLGYRYVINQATFSGNVTPGQTMNVSLSIVNKGSSPMYYNWPVEASLLRADKSVAWSGTFNTNITQWLPGTNWNSSSRTYSNAPAVNTVSGAFTIPSNLAAGTYTLAVAVLDPAGNKPSVRFANTNYYNGGRTPLGKVGIGQDPSDQNLGTFNSLKSDNSLSYSLTGGSTPTATPAPTATPTATPAPTATPTATPTPNSTSYEAEASANTLAGAAVISTCTTCSGGNKVGYVGNNNGTLQFNGVNVSTAGTYTLKINYLNGDTSRSASISVNGGSLVTLNFANSGGWTTVGTLQTSVSLQAGNNTIKLSNATGYAPDFDRITIVGGTGTPTPTPTGTPSPTPTPTPGGGLYLDTFNNAALWPGTNSLGKWTGANSFSNGAGAGVISSGALALQYNNTGWFGSDINQDISAYTTMIIRIKGAVGGEQTHINVNIGGVTKTLALFSSNTLTTSYKDIAFNLVSNGVNRVTPGNVALSFSNGFSGTVYIDEIKFQ